MTTYRIKRKGHEALLEVQGHSDYDIYGKDIVCASISTALIFTANLIEKLNLGYNIMDLVCEEGYFRLQIKTSDLTANAVFENLEYTLEEISKQYPKNLKFINQEDSFMLKLNLQLFASKKGVGSTKNGHDSEAKRLGAKASD